MKHKKKGGNISHVNIENMGGRDQSRTKNRSLKSSKNVSPFQKTYQKVITMTGLFFLCSVCGEKQCTGVG